MITKVFLTFPQHLIEQPVLYEMSRKFDVKTNIRGASVTPHIALMALELDGAARDVESAIAHLEALEVHVERLAE